MLKKKAGFTLIETLIIVTMIGILASIVIPQFRNMVIRAREGVLKHNLFLLREKINEYYADKKKYPTSLDELVTSRYIRAIPDDPFTKKKDWLLIYPEPVEGDEFDPDIAMGIIDVKSQSKKIALDGSNYSDW